MARAKKEDTKSEQDAPRIDDFQNANRIMNGKIEIMTDTFKLAVATMLKNIGVDGREKQLVAMEHCHIFHTYDSNGKKLDRCNHVGGHTHQIELSIDSKGNFVGKCSPPIQNSMSEKIANEDRHTHNVIYVKSEVLEPRVMNMDAQQYIATMSKPATVDVPVDQLKFLQDAER